MEAGDNMRCIHCKSRCKRLAWKDGYVLDATGNMKNEAILMDEKLFNSKKVNPAWLKTHVVGLFSEIYDMINAKEHPTDEELLIAAKIEWEWFRYNLPNEWLGIYSHRRRITFIEKLPRIRKRRKGIAFIGKSPGLRKRR